MRCHKLWFIIALEVAVNYINIKLGVHLEGIFCDLLKENLAYIANV